MTTRSPAGGPARRARLLAAALVLLMGAAIGTVAAPSPAAAQTWIIPPGGWCYYDWYTVTTNHGEVFERYGTRKFFENNSSVMATWNQSLTVSTTFTSTQTYTTNFSGGVSFGPIQIGVQNSTSRTVTRTISVSETSGFSVGVPPGITMYAEYGVKKLKTSGNYHQSQHECGTWDYETVTSGALTAYSVLSGSVGWRIWEG